MLRGYKGISPTVAPGESSVWMNAIVRGDVNHVRIGRRTDIQDGAVVHGCTVAAGTLLPEGCVVPPRSLVMGSPGKVQRAITDDEYALIRQSAENYVAYRLDYL